MKVSLKHNNDMVIIKVEGSLVTEHIKEVEYAVKSALDIKKNIVFDFNELAFICSAGLSLLLSTQKKAQAQGLKMVVIGCSKDIIKLFTLTGLDQHLILKNTIDEAHQYITTQ